MEEDKKIQLLKTVGLVIWTITGVVFCAFVIFCFASEIKSRGASLQQSTEENKNLTNLDYILKNDVELTIGKYETKDGKYWFEGYLPITIKNISKDTATFSFGIEAFNTKGERVEIDSFFVRSLAPGKTAKVKAFEESDDDTEKYENVKFVIYEGSKDQFGNDDY